MSTASQEQQKENAGNTPHVNAWQRKMLPWLIIMPTVLIVVFIILATLQMSKFNEALIIKPDNILNDTSILLLSKQGKGDMRWMTLVRLEEQSYYRRYNQGSMTLMARIYKQYLGFFTGMILAIVGAVFIIGKLREDTSTITLSTEAKLNASLASSSPGIVFGLLGTILMITTMVSHNDVVIEDAPLYLNAQAIIALDQPDAPVQRKAATEDIKKLLGQQALEIKKQDSLKNLKK